MMSQPIDLGWLVVCFDCIVLIAGLSWVIIAIGQFGETYFFSWIKVKLYFLVDKAFGYFTSFTTTTQSLCGRVVGGVASYLIFIFIYFLMEDDLNIFQMKNTFILF